VKVVKNKMAPPFREVEFDILYGQGISKAGDIIDLATDLGIVDKSGAWFSFSGERIGQGRENAKAYLEQHPQLADKLEQMILAKHNIRPREPRVGDAALAESAKDAKKQELAPDGKPVVKLPVPVNGKGGGGADEKKPAQKPAN
jgi:recombination protein RecA